MHPRMPSEIRDYIIDYLWDDDYSLAACALTARSWLPASRCHLFRAISLKTWKNWSSFDALLQESVSSTSINSDPTMSGASVNIADYVHELDISCGNYFFLDRNTGLVNRVSLTIVLPTVRRVLSMLQRVTHLKLSYMNSQLWVEYRETFYAISSTSPASGPNDSPNAKEGRGVHTLSLVCLEFLSYEQFNAMLASYPHLVVLNLENIGWTGTPLLRTYGIDVPPSSARLPICQPSPSIRNLGLTVLSIGAQTFPDFHMILSLFNTPSTPISLAHIETLHMVGGLIRGDIFTRSLGLLLDGIGPSLRSLHIWPASKTDHSK